MSFNDVGGSAFEDYLRAGGELDISINNWDQLENFDFNYATGETPLTYPWLPLPQIDNEFDTAPVAPVYQQPTYTGQQHDDGASNYSQLTSQPQLQLLQQQLAEQSQPPYHNYPVPQLPYAQPLQPTRYAASTAVSNEPTSSRVHCPVADCNCTFINKAGLRKHQKLKHNSAAPERVACTQCNKTFADRKGLKRHCDSQHAKNGKVDKFACPGCKKKYPRQDFVVRHMKTHHPELVHHKITDGKRIAKGVVVERESARKARM